MGFGHSFGTVKKQGRRRVRTGLSLLAHVTPDHVLKKNGGVSHPAVRFFSGYFVSHGADEIRAIASVEPATR